MAVVDLRLQVSRVARTGSLRLVVGVGLSAAALLGAACVDDEPPPTAAAHRLVIEPCRGPVAGRASAAAVAPDLLATAAHSLDGAASITIADADGRAVDGIVVHLDLAKDVALVRTGSPLPHHFELAEPDEGDVDTPVDLVTYADADGPVTKQGRLLELVDVTLDGEGRRAALRLEGDIEPGDSGSAVLDGDGRMVGLVFASSRGRDAGWAVAAPEIQAAIDSVEQHRPGAVLPAC